MDLEKICKQVISLCAETGEYIAQEQTLIANKDIQTKGLHDYVTHVDKNSEQKLVSGLQEILPEAGFLVEENTIENAGKDYTWVIDPLDGTTNFIHGLPVYAISIALLRDRKVILGAVYDVKARECFYAWEGSQAFLNGNEIHVSDTIKLGDSLLATGFPYNDFSRQEGYLEMLGTLMRSTRGIRRYGSAAIDLAWIACGRFDGFWEYSLKPWDVAAGSFIVQQAGGLVSDFRGEQNFLFYQEIVCGNPNIYRELLKLTEERFE